jgi:hypothetical protein
LSSLSIGARKDLTDRQWRILEPAFYMTSWAPWLRIIATAIVVVLAIMVLRITPVR